MLIYSERIENRNCRKTYEYRREFSPLVVIHYFHVTGEISVKTHMAIQYACNTPNQNFETFYQNGATDNSSNFKIYRY